MTLLVRDGVLGGETRHKVHVEEFILWDAFYPGRSVVPCHAHERACFAFVLDGLFTESLGRHNALCSRFDLTVKPAGAEHTDTYGGEGARILIIEVLPSGLERLSSHSKVFDVPLHITDGRLAAPCIRAHQELLRSDDVTPLIIEGAMLELVADVLRTKARGEGISHPAWLRRAEEALHEYMAEPLSLRRIAQEVGVHPVHLAQVFRRAYGCSPGQYVRQLRIDTARRLLLNTQKPLTQIAFACGFYDQSHFTKTFKRYTGITPSQLRWAEIRSYRRPDGAD